jgi:hypothetical protein
LVGDDHKRIPKLKGKYVFGHFELPHFFMNAMVQMPDHGELKRESFGNIEHVFTGHFHKRQTHKNITYIGNCFPHNYADADDDERGLTVLEWGKEPEFHAWPDQPTYRVLGLGAILNHADKILKPKMHVRVNIDIDISYEEANFIKETYMQSHSLREITLIPQKNVNLEEYAIQGNVAFESVDQIVTNQITNIESNQFDSRLLLDIYRNL